MIDFFGGSGRREGANGNLRYEERSTFIAIAPFYEKRGERKKTTFAQNDIFTQPVSFPLDKFAAHIYILVSGVASVVISGVSAHFRWCFHHFLRGKEREITVSQGINFKMRNSMKSNRLARPRLSHLLCSNAVFLDHEKQ